MKPLLTLSTFCLGSLFLVLLPIINCNAQSGTWIWMNGPDTVDGPGNYGVQGAPSVNNCPPAITGAAQWTDKNGNFWIFGGWTTYNNLTDLKSDLWKYDPTTNIWTWVKGPGIPNQLGVYGTLRVPSPDNNPGARGSEIAWTDSAGDLWLWGGYGQDTLAIGNLSDMWRYHIASNEWTWMGGPSHANQPGVYGILHQASGSSLPPPRGSTSAAWTDANNNLWFYGGLNEDTFYGDIWRYSIVTGQWAWMGGTQETNNTGNYGTLGIESPTNFPATRSCYAHWLDSNYLYIACGWYEINPIQQVFDSVYFYNDVWQFNMNTNYWTWIGGNAGTVPDGQYTSYCREDSLDVPSGRFGCCSAQLNTCPPVLFIWGGQGNNEMNDLWSFNLSTRKWRWVNGSNNSPFLGDFGIRGLAASTNMPPGLNFANMWSDNAGNLWLWGGHNFALHDYNAIWEYIPDTACFPAGIVSADLSYQLSPQAICNGDSASIGFTGGSAINISPANYVTWLDSLHAIIMPDTTTVFTITGYSPCGLYQTQVFTLPVLNPMVTISSNKTIMCPGDSVQICAPSGFTGYTWSNGDTAACINTTTADNYLVTVTANGNCSATSNSISISVYTPSAVTLSVSGDTLTGIGGSSYQWLLNGVSITGATSSVYIAQASGTYTLQSTDVHGCIANSSPVLVTGIISQLSENSISVFPNPTNTGWQLSVTGELIGSIAEVFNATGQIVFQSAISNQQSAISIPNAASGVYELRITGQGYSVVRKLLKM